MLHKNNIDNERFDDLTGNALTSAMETQAAWTDFNTHDPGVMLVELFAWLTECQRFYMAQSESADVFFPLLGAVPKKARPASVLVTAAEAAGAFFPEGTHAMAEEIRFETVSDVPKDFRGEIILLQKHTLCNAERPETWLNLGIANGFPKQKFTVNTYGQKILCREFSIVVADEAAEQVCKWVLVDDFRLSEPNDPHFTLNPVSGEVAFGDGIQGKMPWGIVWVNSLVLTHGSGGNIMAQRLTELVSGGNMLAVVQPDHAEGGAEAETAGQTLARTFSERRQAVTNEDIALIATETPDVEIEHATAFAAGTEREQGKPRIIQIAAKPVGERAELTPQQKHAIRKHLEPYRLAGCEFEIQSPTYVAINFNIEIQAHKHGGGLVKTLEAAARQFFDETYGGFAKRIGGRAMTEFLSGFAEVISIAACDVQTYNPNAKKNSRGIILLPQGAWAYLKELKIRVRAC